MPFEQRNPAYIKNHKKTIIQIVALMTRNADGIYSYRSALIC
jgi:hypothetical protein